MLKSIKNKFVRQPIIQSLAIVVLAIIILMLERILALIGIIMLSPNFAWEGLAMGIFLYALFNNILSLTSVNPTTYWAQSLAGFVILFLLLSGFAYLVSGVFITELDIFRNIVFVLSIGYFIIASIVRLIRFFMEWAKRQDELREN